MTTKVNNNYLVDDLSTAKNMLKDGINISNIMKYTGLTKNEILIYIRKN